MKTRHIYYGFSIDSIYGDAFDEYQDIFSPEDDMSLLACLNMNDCDKIFDTQGLLGKIGRTSDTSFFDGLRPAQKLVTSFISYLLYHIPYHISYQIFYHISYQVSHHIMYNNRYHILTCIIIYIILFNMCVDIHYEVQIYLRWPELRLMTHL